MTQWHRFVRRSAEVLAGWMWACPAGAFNGQVVTEGPLRVEIAPIGVVTQTGAAIPVQITLSNRAEAPLAVTLRLDDFVDECRAAGPAKTALTLPGHVSATQAFAFTAGPGIESALYPVHAYAEFTADGARRTAHVVQIFETKIEAAPMTSTWPVLEVPARGGLALAATNAQRVSWARYDGPEQALPLGWQGRDEASYASFNRDHVDRGGVRAALHMHPPYREGGGTMFADFRLRLPKTTPITFAFVHAIRDTGPTEPPSDGVTFRVWAEGKVLFERHSDAKQWTPGEADLSPLAGREITLRLECHPGPARNTVCDSSFWGDPVVWAGPKPASGPAMADLAAQARAVAAGAAPVDGIIAFDLAGGRRAALAPGPNGLADGALALGAAGRAVVFAGFDVILDGARLGQWPSAVATTSLRIEPRAGAVRLVQKLQGPTGPATLTTELVPDGPALRIAVDSSLRIDDLAAGPADRRAARVFFGHGYCVEEPGAFTVHPGGHALAASHVGFEFDDGPALLMASTRTPDRLEVDPARQRYTLHVRPATVFTLLPGPYGALECAWLYRPLDGRTPAPAFAEKAGRFVFDWWGGRYTQAVERLERAFVYGLSDSLVVYHVWQRWGYDYRLPDIYPPDPGHGSLSDLQRLSALCRSRGVPFALHDNYIDFYPDAQDYSYEHITFDDAGRPRKAWLNEGRQAQSYQWRPDRILPFVKRNLNEIAPGLQPTAYFLDVFTSAGIFDYRDREGRFHSRAETAEKWGEAFAWIRGRLGGRAPMISESGGDQLLGAIEGADCQFLSLGPEWAAHVLRVPCRDWERVPWMDLVHHRRYSLHGVGYSDRYQNQRPRADHGIESDDYLNAELLTGHALMIDWQAGLRGAVRKYWLAQDFIRGLAGDDIRAVEFVGGDIHRLKVTWSSSASVLANRGTNDWDVDGRVLPPYGFLARGPRFECGVERRGGRVAEYARGGGRWYVNARGATEPIDWDAVTTRGALLLVRDADGVTAIPLPDAPAFEVTLNPAVLGLRGALARVIAHAPDGRALRDVPATLNGAQITFQTAPAEFAYRLEYHP